MTNKIITQSNETEKTINLMNHYALSGSGWELNGYSKTASSSGAMQRSKKEKYLEDCKKKLITYKCLNNNWDGFGAKAINDKVIEAFEAFIDKLSSDVELPIMLPEPTGMMGMRWTNNGHDMLLRLSEDGKIHYNLENKQGEILVSEASISAKYGISFPLIQILRGMK